MFDEIIITDDLGGIEYRKPNMKAFQIMRNKFGMEYEEMCYIGDNRLKDFQAPEPVSYTHLDVYKRQGQDSGSSGTSGNARAGNVSAAA